MAGAGQPFYMPLLFPFGNLIGILSDKLEPVKPKAVSSLDITGHLTSICASTRSFLISLFMIYYLYNDYSYPAFGGGKKFSLDWIIPIIIRNLIGTLLICGVWDYILYFSPLKDKLEKFKFNKVYPSNTQIKHDIFYTLLSSINAGIIEIIMCYMYSNNYISYDNKSVLKTPLKSLFFVFTLTHFRVIHFYIIHRMIHPWKKFNSFDPGKWLYKYVHSLHHKSYNPTAFSGTNMHPIESLLYYSAAFIFVPFKVHPIISMAIIVDSAVGAWLGHDGFQWPGSGDYFHQLHHAHFDCNYGAMHFPIDKWFGTFVGCKEDLKKIWGKKSNSVGKEYNSKVCKVHPE